MNSGKYCSIRHLKFKEMQTEIFGRIGSAQYIQGKAICVRYMVMPCNRVKRERGSSLGTCGAHCFWAHVLWNRVNVFFSFRNFVPLLIKDGKVLKQSSTFFKEMKWRTRSEQWGYPRIKKNTVEMKNNKNNEVSPDKENHCGVKVSLLIYFRGGEYGPGCSSPRCNYMLVSLRPSMKKPTISLFLAAKVPLRLFSKK